MKFLYIEKDQDIRDIYVMKLEADFKAHIHEASNPDEAKQILKTHKDFAFIISDLEAAAGPGGVYTYIHAEKINIPYVILSNEDIGTMPEFANFNTDHTGNKIIQTPIQEEKFRAILVEVIKSSGREKELHELPTTEYSSVKLRTFLKFSSVPVDIFIRLSEQKFVKLLNRDDMYSYDIVKKYMDKGVEFLFVRQEDHVTLADTSIRTLLQIYDRKSLSKDQKQAIQMMALEDIHKHIQQYGLDEKSVELTKKTMETSVAVMKRSPSLWQLLKKMKSEGDYIYQHSLKLSYICTAIAKNSEWNSDSTCYKLSLASMMHDMTLSNHDLAKIQVLSDENLEKYPPEEVEKYKKHPLESSLLVKNDRQLPRDVDFIIHEHHERPDGTGFPRGLSKLRIAPLSCIFICAHEFLTRLDRLGGEMTDQNKNKVIAEMAQSFGLGNFKKPFEGLKKAFDYEGKGKGRKAASA